MSTHSHFVLQAIGSKDIAAQVLQRAIREVPAYAALRRVGSASDARIETAPIIDKSSYVAKHTLSELMGANADHAFSLIASSGSSGKAVFWPQLRPENASMVADFIRFLELGFEVHKKRTLAIVGLALGSWIGGDMFSWSLKNVAMSVKYPMCVLTTGNRHEEILRVLAAADGYADQILLVVCPSAIGHLHLLAQSQGVAIPHKKMRYLVLGEPFPEQMRTHLRTMTTESAACPVLSVYGSADTGLLGAESVASAALRGLLADDASFGDELGIPGAPPHMFHCSASDAYIEDINGELVVTRWQGVPLVRYNLHDNVRLLSWRALRAAAIAHAKPHSLLAILKQSPEDLPDVIAIDGRADRCVILCGTNITESMLDESIRRVASDPSFGLSGHYHAWITLDNGRQRLAVSLESIKDARLHDAAIYQRLVAELGRVQPEFLDDWSNVYKRWDESPEHRILNVSYVPWPSISSRPDGAIKAKGIVQEPPKYGDRGGGM